MLKRTCSANPQPLIGLVHANAAVSRVVVIGERVKTVTDDVHRTFL